MIDLRSDTVTRPSDGMRRAMCDADVGDDVYGEDPSVSALEEHVAALAGFEAGLFCVTGSLANLLGVWLHSELGTDVLCDAQAHIVRAEMGAHALLHGVTTRTWTSDDGRLDADVVTSMVAPDAGLFLVRTACIEVEDTHNFGGGTIQPLDQLRAVTDFAKERGIKTHLDGARIWHACVATCTTLAQRCAGFSSASVCFSKGLGAPVGSMLLASRADIDRARIQRKRLGAGWRQAGLLAAAARYAVDHHVDALTLDHEHARQLAAGLEAVNPGSVMTPSTNVVLWRVDDAPAMVRRCADEGLLVGALDTHTVRLVTHRDTDDAACQRALAILTPLSSSSRLHVSFDLP